MSIEAQIKVHHGGFTLHAQFTSPSQGITAIFGPSGCGKTTLLRSIAGLEPSASGTLTVDGKVWQDQTSFLPPHRRPLGYVFQEASLFPHLSVRGNLEYALKRLRNGHRISFEHAVDLLGVEPLLARRPNKLSGGERQRVAIARALLTSPKVLLMDEPLAALDQNSKQGIFPFLEKLNKDLSIPVLYVSHSFTEVARLADHMILMEAGKVSAVGPLNTMLTRFDLPLAHDNEAEVMIEAKVEAHDNTYQLTHLDFVGGRITVAQKKLPVGQSVRLRIQASDVSITLQAQIQTSILNIFPATVRELSDEGNGQVTVFLQIAQASLLSRITKKSVDTLGLHPGTPVFVQIKSVALLA